MTPLTTMALAADGTCMALARGRVDLSIQVSAMTTIHADQLQPGDVVVYGGHRRQITHVERRRGWAWPIATDDSGWAIALGHQLIDVHRNAA